MAQLLAEYGDNSLCLTLHRPEQRNALSYSLLEELHRALSSEMKTGCRAVIISGSHNCFSAGADLNELTGTAMDEEMDAAINRVTDDILRLSMTTVASIEGACIGGAVDIAMACEVRVASHNAYFQVPAARLGLLYNPDSVARMSKLFSHDTLTRLFVSGENFTAADAVKAGLVTHLVKQQAGSIKTVKPARNPVADSGRAVISTRSLLDTLYNDRYDPTYWRAVYKDILASPERREAVTRARRKQRPGQP